MLRMMKAASCGTIRQSASRGLFPIPSCPRRMPPIGALPISLPANCRRIESRRLNLDGATDSLCGTVLANVVRDQIGQSEGKMAHLKGTKSYENLKLAFAGEAQANIGGLFRDTAEAETGYAFGHLDFLKEVGDPVTDRPMGQTEANLASA